MSGNLYFNWDGVPSVVVDGGDNKNSLLRYMPSGSDSWVPADVMLLPEWMKVGNLSKDDFEKEFGMIGKELPKLPEVT
mgnify:CR=1